MSLDDRDYMRDSARRVMREHYYNPKAYRRQRNSPRRSTRVSFGWWVAGAAATVLVYEHGYTSAVLQVASVVRRLVGL